MRDEDAGRPDRVRREPPPLQPVSVTARAVLSPRMVRLSFQGNGLQEMGVADPAASIRLLVPSPGTDELVIPTWNGNEFLLADGARPALRTFTPLRVDRAVGRLDLEIVRHPGGQVSEWAAAATPGAPAAISGPGKGYAIESQASAFLLIGDETALPAITDLLPALPNEVAVEVHLEVVSAEAELPLPDHPRATVTWHVRGEGERPGAALVAQVQTLDRLDPGARIWAAGAAASMQAIRKHLFKTLELPRAQATVRGYWKESS